MTNPEPDFEMLSAYVDSELDPPEASRLARLIAADESLARRVARLFEMKEGVAKLAPEVVVVTVPQARSARRLFAPLALAAGFFAAVLGAVVWIGMPHLTPNETVAQNAVGDAVLLHDRWTSEAQPAAAPAALPAGFFAPELVSAGLTLSMVQSGIALAGRPAVQAGYVGRHGCRLSLFETKSEDGEETFSVTSRADLQSATWTSGDLRYLLVARRMDEARFTVIAGVLRTMTARRGAADPDHEAIAELQTARQPCVG
jgi:anti-sigma factor RsiW